MSCISIVSSLEAQEAILSSNNQKLTSNSSSNSTDCRAGIGYSDDKLLQWRLVAYDDTQRYRIGPNFGLLPVNAPRCPVYTTRQDGPLNSANQTGAVNYYPSDFASQVRYFCSL